MLSVQSMAIAPKGGFDAQIQVYKNTNDQKVVDVHLPAGTGLGQTTVARALGE